MAANRRRQMVLVAVLAAVSLVAAFQYLPRALPSGAGTAVQRTDGGGAVTPSLKAPDVRLRALAAERPAPDHASRNPFRYGTRIAPVANTPRPPLPASPPMPPQPRDVPSGPPAPPPITMRFIGLVEAPQNAQRIAILSDGRGIYQGREGDIIEGRYRILHIGAESVEMAYLDGRGRQTIRLSGS